MDDSKTQASADNHEPAAAVFGDVSLIPIRIRAGEKAVCMSTFVFRHFDKALSIQSVNEGGFCRNCS
jgi:hypothetical protein